MTPNILENISTWLVDWSLVTIMGNTTPPRDPNDENDEDDEDDKDDEDDEDDKDNKDDIEDDENDDDERHARLADLGVTVSCALARRLRQVHWRGNREAAQGGQVLRRQGGLIRPVKNSEITANLIQAGGPICNS
jgi:ABC-type Zn2+ transport system substrate-binding protein/surface adhesin